MTSGRCTALSVGVAPSSVGPRRWRSLAVPPRRFGRTSGWCWDSGRSRPTPSFRYVDSFNRPNLRLEVLPIADSRERLRHLTRLVRGIAGAGIVYAPTRNLTEAIARILHQNGTRAVPYHAGLTKERRSATLGSVSRQRCQGRRRDLCFRHGDRQARCPVRDPLDPTVHPGGLLPGSRARREGWGAVALHPPLPSGRSSPPPTNAGDHLSRSASGRARVAESSGSGAPSPVGPALRRTAPGRTQAGARRRPVGPGEHPPGGGPATTSGRGAVRHHRAVSPPGHAGVVRGTVRSVHGLRRLCRCGASGANPWEAAARELTRYPTTRSEPERQRPSPRVLGWDAVAWR